MSSNDSHSLTLPYTPVKQVAMENNAEVNLLAESSFECKSALDLVKIRSDAV